MQRSSNDPIWIAHVDPFSGSDKALGEHAKQGLLLTVEDVNREDQRIHKRRVSVVHADDHGDPEAAQAEAVRLIALHRPIALLGGSRPAEAERMARTAQSYGLAAVLLSALPSSGSTEGLLSLSVAPTYQGTILGRFVQQHFKSARVVVIADSRSSFFTEIASAFIREFAKERPEEWTYQNDNEQLDLVKRLKKAPPSVVLIAAPARDFLRFAAQIKEEDIKTALIFGGSEGEILDLQADRNASQGVYLATTYWPESNASSNQEFVKKYQEKFKDPPDVSAALAVEGLRLLADNLRKARIVDASELRREMQRADKLDGLMGPITFGKDAHARRTLFVVQLDNGKPKLISQFDPDGK